MIYQVVRGELGAQLFQAAFGLMIGALTGQAVRWVPLDAAGQASRQNTLLAQCNPAFAVETVSLESLAPACMVFTELPSDEPPPGQQIKEILTWAPQLAHLLLDGTWASERYWSVLDNIETFEAHLRRTLSPQFDNPEVLAHAQTLRETPHIGILMPRNDSTQASQASILYYRNSLEQLRRETGMLPVLVFSDNPQLTQTVLADLPGVMILQANQEVPAFDLLMLSQCSHFILAGDALSFWAAMLANRPDSIVYYPASADGFMLGRRSQQWRMGTGATPTLQ